METPTLPPAEFVIWQTGTPDVKEGGEGRFWCAVKPRGNTNVFHCFLSYCNGHIMPLSDSCCEPPVGVEPVGDDGDFKWTGWFEASCDQCETQWTYDGEVIAWMKLPRLPKQ